MQVERNKASSPQRAASPIRNLLLLVSCIVGLLVGLSIFGLVCYLLMQ
jgi:LPS O-antigen subunit length determinant protein (WzzB/FepE family)